MTIYHQVFQTASKYPLAEQLKTALAKVRPPRNNARLAQLPSDIVSPSLCDDTLKHIAPSLEAYKGCDIIDLHPGPCLWSQKLHDVVKPRRHLLMEPNPDYFTPFIKPLLDQQGSAYRHTTLSGAHPQSYWSAYAHIFNDALLPSRPTYEADDPRLRQPDRTLLVTGSLHRTYKGLRKTSNAVNYPSLILNHMVQAAQTNTMFHMWGLVRMLVWVPESTRDQVYSVSLAGKSPFSTCIEAVCDMTQIVAPDGVSDKADSMGRRLRRTRLRPAAVDKYSMRSTIDRMNKLGLSIPEHRQRPELAAALANPDVDEPVRFDLSDDADLRAEIDEQSKLIQQFKNELAAPRKREYRPDKMPVLRSSHFTVPPGYTLPVETKTTLYYEFLHRKMTVLASLSHRQAVLEHHLCKRTASLDPTTSSSLSSSLILCATNLREIQTSIHGRAIMMTVLDVLEEERAIRTNPPVIPYDRRPVDPILTTPDEFYPQNPLHLLDISPRARNLTSDITSAAEGNAVMRDLAQTLMMRPREDVVRALDRIAPNAGRDLVAATPSLRDASRGGRLDPRDLSARCIDRDMFLDLVHAFLEWPFRPTTVELAVSQAGLGGGGEKDAIGEGDGDGKGDGIESEIEDDDML